MTLLQKRKLVGRGDNKTMERKEKRGHFGILFAITIILEIRPDLE